MTTTTKWDPYTKAPKVGDCTWETIFTGYGIDTEDDWIMCEKATGHKDYPEWHGLEFYRVTGCYKGKKISKRFYGESAWADSRRVCSDVDFRAWSAPGWGY